MRHPRSRQPSNHPDASASAPLDIDALYGLDPVFEPGREQGQARGAAATFHTIQCPYCGERFDTLVDASAGAAAYIEDCQICCQPIELELQVDSSGALRSLRVHRC
ncbi:MAG: CPXCG motif-containing cysteine-rich protein [Steroidobacteraceae bacterium]